MTFQEQCMKTVFPRFIEGINAANRRAKDLEAKVQELEVQLADALDRVNSLEAKAAEKKTRKPRAKKQDPVQSVEEAAKRAAVDKAMDAVLEDAARRESVVSTPEQAMNEIPF